MTYTVEDFVRSYSHPLEDEEKTKFGVQRAVLILGVAGSFALLIWTLGVATRFRSMALDSVATMMQTRDLADSDSRVVLAGTKKRILVETAKALAQESAPAEDKARRMENLQILFNLEKRVESVAKQKAMDTAKVDAVTYYQDPRTGGITPLNQTETGSLDPQKLRGVLGQDRSLALLLAIANRRTQDEAPKDLDAIIQADLTKAKAK